MPRTPLTADAAYAFANRIFPDEGPLAIFNAIFEIHADKLTADDAEAAAAADDDDVSLAAIIGHVNLQGAQFCFNQSFANALPTSALMRQAVDAILALESGTLEEESGEDIEIGFPTTIAVMAVWHKDGRLWTAFYRHPDVGARLAAAILKDVVVQLKMKKEDADTDGFSKN